MKVTGNNTYEAEHLKKLTNSQRQLITQKEAEISALNKLYNEKTKIVKNEGEVEVFNQVEKNQVALENSILAKEQQLERIKQDLKDSSDKFEGQKSYLDESYKDKFSHMNRLHTDNILTFSQENEEQAKDISNKANREILDITDKVNQEISNNLHDSKVKSNEISAMNNREIASIQANFKNEKQSVQNDQDEVIKEVKKNHEKNVQEFTNKNEFEINERKKAINAEMTNNEVQHADSLKQKRLSFEEKYNELEKNHTEILSRLKVRLDQEIKKATDSYAESRALLDKRSDDQFYKVTKFEPTVNDKLDHYVISIPVPEYEKELVNLTAQNRNVIVTLNRKYTDEIEDGLRDESFKTSRSEVLTKKFKVLDLMDSKKITTNYADGHLNFKIMKL